jgi:hypothetical protein
MIKKLRADWIAKTAPAAASGGAAPGTPGLPADPTSAATIDPKVLHDFHDKFLSFGGPPIPLVRKAMVGDGGSLL